MGGVHSLISFISNSHQRRLKCQIFHKSRSQALWNNLSHHKVKWEDEVKNVHLLVITSSVIIYDDRKIPPQSIDMVNMSALSSPHSVSLKAPPKAFTVLNFNIHLTSTIHIKHPIIFYAALRNAGMQDARFTYLVAYHF